MNTNKFELREWRLYYVASLAENANNIRVWNNLRDYFPHPYSENDGIQFIQMVSAKPKPATDMAIVVDGKAVGGIGIILRTDVERISKKFTPRLSVSILLRKKCLKKQGLSVRRF